VDVYIQRLIERYPDLADCVEAIEQAYTLLVKAFQQRRKLLICGNGGSAADSEHIVGELMKGFRSRRSIPDSTRERLIAEWPQEGAYISEHLQGALSALSLSAHTAFATAFANDVAADLVFAQQVFGYGEPGDVLLCISTSGRSTNVCQAARVAQTLGLHTIGLTGRDGGLLATLCDIAICVPRSAVEDIQEMHLPVYHTLCLMLEAHFFCE
jgi:D-sedoheptulose 7-phosphate isomerase